jgi:class 3 adenylate cyclase
MVDVSDRPVYANLLTRLFEFIAKLVDDQGGMVEEYFGDGYLLVVMQRLQRQAELQGNIILDAFIGMDCC